MNTRPTYTPDALAPVAIGPFTHRQRYRDLQKAKYTSSVVPLPNEFDVHDHIQPIAVAAIRKAFTLAKTSHAAWKSNRREGRFDVRQAPRIHTGAQDVFKRKTGRSTTKVKVSVLIDASGSMSHPDAYLPHPTAPGRKVKVSRKLAAATFGATIATALGRVPTIDLDVYEHAGHADSLHIKWRWAKGTPTRVFNEAAYRGIGGGANADGHAVIAIATRMIQERKRDERAVIMVVSDGLPTAYSTTGKSNEHQALKDAVKFCRDNGIIVMAVAIDGSDQSDYYGKDGTIPFTGNWTALGTALARTIGTALAKTR